MQRIVGEEFNILYIVSLMVSAITKKVKQTRINWLVEELHSLHTAELRSFM
jgi:hypothetical protein